MGRFAILLAALLAACTPMQWVRQDATPEQLNQDLAQCQQESAREAQWRAFMHRPFGHTFIVDRFGRRFLWPHSPLDDPFGDQFMEESRLIRFCMRAKGYELAPVKPKNQSRRDDPAFCTRHA
jgi:hypothetical protein